MPFLFHWSELKFWGRNFFCLSTNFRKHQNHHEQNKQNLDKSIASGNVDGDILAAGIQGATANETTIDKSQFAKSIPLVAVRVPARETPQWLKKLSGSLLDIPKVKVIANDGESKETRLLLLRPKLSRDLVELSESQRAQIQTESLGIMDYTLNLDYSYWSADEILKSILPAQVHDEIPGSFTAVGHIAHMNLRDEYLPWKHIIGQVILDKNPSMSTVVNKLDTIDNEFRNFKMEVLAGKPEFNVEVKENDCRFRFDFSKVYWNSRLDNEHARIMSMFKKGDVIADVFAGVGPFAVPSARKGCFVYANDLNPASYEALKTNMSLNKVADYVRPFNLDGRDFIALARKHLAGDAFKVTLTPPKKKRSAPVEVSTPETVISKTHFDHYVFNLPAIALEFLDALRTAPEPLPVAHVHCFSKSDTPHEDILDRVERAIGYRPILLPESQVPASGILDCSTLLPGHCFIHYVRKVAPNKSMYCITFRLKSSDNPHVL